jgi:hypothetical protein
MLISDLWVFHTLLPNTPYFLAQTGGLVWVRPGRNSAWTIARAASQDACVLNSWKATPVSGVGAVPGVGLADMKKAINMYKVSFPGWCSDRANQLSSLFFGLQNTRRNMPNDVNKIILAVLSVTRFLMASFCTS